MHMIGSRRVYQLSLTNAMYATNCDWCVYGHAAAGNTRALRALWTMGTYLAKPLFGSIAASGDHLETLQWLLEHGVAFDAQALASNAAAGGATTVLQWLWDKVKLEGCDLEALRDLLGVIQQGALTRATEDTRTLDWLRGLPGVRFLNPLDHLIHGMAAGAGNLVALRWLIEEAGLPPAGLSAAEHAAAGGHLGVLAYLHKHGEVFTESVADAVHAPFESLVRDASRAETERWLEEETGVISRWARERAEAADAMAEAAKKSARTEAAKKSARALAGGRQSWTRGAWNWLSSRDRGYLESLPPVAPVAPLGRLLGGAPAIATVATVAIDQLKLPLLVAVGPRV
jgi:hypothetical protein